MDVDRGAQRASTRRHTYRQVLVEPVSVEVALAALLLSIHVPVEPRSVDGSMGGIERLREHRHQLPIVGIVLSSRVELDRRHRVFLNDVDRKLSYRSSG